MLPATHHFCLAFSCRFTISLDIAMTYTINMSGVNRPLPGACRVFHASAPFANFSILTGDIYPIWNHAAGSQELDADLHDVLMEAYLGAQDISAEDSDKGLSTIQPIDFRVRALFVTPCRLPSTPAHGCC